jgi:DNA-binding PadR family transcriptional regulator
MPKRKLDPLPSAAFQILLALAGEDLHGYGIMRQVAEQTESRMRLGPGTLYSSIQTLVEAKLIEEVDQREDAKLGQERRRYYRLTSGGRKLARSEAERLADLLRVARAKRIFFSPAVSRELTAFQGATDKLLTPKNRIHRRQ